MKANGMGSATRFYSPVAVAVGRGGSVYAVEYGNTTIRKITPGRIVRTLAGLAGNIGSTAGTGSVARFDSPESVAVEGSS
jgi:hypothetical protein